MQDARYKMQDAQIFRVWEVISFLRTANLNPEGFAKRKDAGYKMPDAGCHRQRIVGHEMVGQQDAR